jgi:hypothetical protein
MLGCTAMLPAPTPLARLDDAQLPTIEAGLVLFLFVASSGTVQQHLGLTGVGAYLAGLVVAVPLATRLVLPLIRARLSDQTALWLAVATFALLTIAFFVVYPHANSHGAASGSDRDDAATIATRHLLHFQYPYSTLTYLGNPISQLPGALILDIPFVALGNAAYANVLWLPALFALLWWILRDPRVALWLTWLLLVLSPALVREYLTGGDVIANTVAVLAFGLGTLTLPQRWQRLASAALLGLALSWRPNFLYWVPLLAAELLRRRGARDTAWVVATALAVAACTTFPFYLTHRHGFAPLQTANKVRRYDDILPKSSLVVLGATGLLSVWLAWCSLRSRVDPLLACAAVQLFVLGFVVVLQSIDAHRPDFSFLLIAYGIFFLVPGTAALARRLEPA